MNFLFLQEKYLLFHSPSLLKFKKKKDHLYNFRCPLCGDSQRRKNIARAYCYAKDGNLIFHCHNCSVSMGAENFLKLQNPALYREYVKEKLFWKKPAQTDPKPAPKAEANGIPDELLALPSIESLEPFHPAKKYLRERQIPEEWLSELRWTEDFYALARTLRPGRYDDITFVEARIVIPLVDDLGLIGVQGRTIDGNPIKYVSVKVADRPKRFGANRVDMTRKHYIVEGPFDAMLLGNAIATGDTNLMNAANQNSILIYDNQPRNRDVCKLMSRAISKGHKIVIWPEGMDGKDINELHLAGVDYRGIIENNIYQGLQAAARMSNWKKV